MSDPTRIRFRLTATSGRDYLSDWIPLSDEDDDESVDLDETRTILLGNFNRAVASGGLLMFIREGRKVGLACTAVELIEVLIEGES